MEMILSGLPANADCRFCGQKIEHAYRWDDDGKSHLECFIANQEEIAISLKKTVKHKQPVK
jgi:hypothetical protein